MMDNHFVGVFSSGNSTEIPIEVGSSANSSTLEDLESSATPTEIDGTENSGIQIIVVSPVNQTEIEKVHKVTESPRYSLSETKATPNLVMSEVLPVFEEDIGPEKQYGMFKTLACFCIPFYFVFYVFPVYLYEKLKRSIAFTWKFFRKVSLPISSFLSKVFNYISWSLSKIFEYLVYTPCSYFYNFIILPLGKGMKFIYVNLGIQSVVHGIYKSLLYIFGKSLECLHYLFSFIAYVFYLLFQLIFTIIYKICQCLYVCVLQPLWNAFENLGTCFLNSDVFNQCKVLTRNYIILPIYNWILMPIWKCILLPLYLAVVYLLDGIIELCRAIGQIFIKIGICIKSAFNEVFLKKG